MHTPHVLITRGADGTRLLSNYSVLLFSSVLTPSEQLKDIGAVVFLRQIQRCLLEMVQRPHLQVSLREQRLDHTHVPLGTGRVERRSQPRVPRVDVHLGGFVIKEEVDDIKVPLARCLMQRRHECQIHRLVNISSSSQVRARDRRPRGTPHRAA